MTVVIVTSLAKVVYWKKFVIVSVPMFLYGCYELLLRKIIYIAVAIELWRWQIHFKWRDPSIALSTCTCQLNEKSIYVGDIQLSFLHVNSRFSHIPPKTIWRINVAPFVTLRRHFFMTTRVLFLIKTLCFWALTRLKVKNGEVRLDKLGFQ